MAFLPVMSNTEREYHQPPDEEAALWAAYSLQPTQRLREEIAQRYFSYARAIAARLYARRGGQQFEFEDYYQNAVLGLMECIDRFRPGQGATFKTYATTRMIGSVLNGLEKLTERQQQQSVQRRVISIVSESDQELDMTENSPEALFRRLASVGVGIALGVLLDGSGLIDWDNGESNAVLGAYEQVELKQLRERVLALVAALPERERHIVRAHYMQDVPFQDIAAEMGLTKGRISQLHRRALDMLRADLAKQRQFAADF